LFFQKPKNMYCEQCGAQLPDSARFCGNCGAATIVNRQHFQMQPQPQPKGNAAAQGIIFIVAVIMIIYALASIITMR
jgi:predicted amidophosphoribosyltransferase